jgi:predicted house-cleaning NTP pyrophosphatase (Maf/HAM1 superfamily)
VYFADNPRELIEAYVESGEGLTVAGGFAIQVFIWLDSSLFSSHII